MQSAGIIFGGVLLLLALGVPVAFAFFTLLFVGGLYYMGPDSPATLTRSIFSIVATFTLVPVPLFVLLAEVLFHSGLAIKVLDAVAMWLGRIPARLSIIAAIGGTIFAAISGSAIACTAMLGSLLLPEMLRRGYGKRISVGAIMATGGVDMIIPPSVLGVVYATVAKVSVAHILIGGVIPGLLMVLGYCIVILLLARFAPGEAPTTDAAVVAPALPVRLQSAAVDILPMAVVIFLVNGLITLGIATPTESAAIGAVGMVALTLLYGRFSWTVLRKSTAECVNVTAMTLLIVAASVGFSQLVGWAGITGGIVGVITSSGLPTWGLITALVVLTLIMGSFLDSISIIMLTTPFYAEIVKVAGVDPLWFGLLMLLSLKVGLTTPPFGILLFVMKAVAPPSISMTDLWRAAIPFVVSDMIVLVLVAFFPPLITWLPSLINP